MSDIQIQLFNSSIRRLTESLIIKDETMANNVNLPILAHYNAVGVDIDDVPKREWKYYLNMAGQYHFTDQPMQVISLDTLETIPFTIEALELHRGTRREYRKKGRYYQDLVNAYPGQEALIKGVLNPVDLQKALNSPNYTILQYDSSEIEFQETNLIPRLQEYIYLTMRRWVVKDYRLADTHYPAAQMAVLYTMIPKMIDTIRLENCKTYKAHSYHIWNYLDSHGYLGEFKDYLLTSQALWLYMNIDWVRANLGKQETFEKLVDKILTKRGIPLGQYTTAIDTTELGANLYGEAYMKRKPLNLQERVGDTTVDKSVEYVMDKQLPLARDNVLNYDTDLVEIKERLAEDNISSYPTKVYESEMIDPSKRLFVTREEALIENWMYMTSMDKYTALINVQNPQSSDVMSMSVKEAFVMWLYVTGRTLGHTLTHVPDMVAHNVPRHPRPTAQDLRKVTSPRYVTQSQLDYLVAETPRVNNLISTVAFYEHVMEVHAAILNHRKYYSVMEHKDTRGQLEGVVQRLFSSVYCEFKITQSYDEWFEANGWDIKDLNATDMQILSEDLMSIATGLNLYDVTSIAEIQAAMLRLMGRLSEYSSQYIQTINTLPATMADFVNVRVGDTWDYVRRLTRQTVGIHVQDTGVKTSKSERMDIVVDHDFSQGSYKATKNVKVDAGLKTDMQATRIIPIKMPMSRIVMR